MVHLRFLYVFFLLVRSVMVYVLVIVTHSYMLFTFAYCSYSKLWCFR